MLKEHEINKLIPPGWYISPKTAEDIIYLGRPTIRQMIRAWRKEEETLKYAIKNWALHNILQADLDEKIRRRRAIGPQFKILQALETQADLKPCLPRYRPEDWFNIGDKVVWFVKSYGYVPGPIIKNRAIKAKVVGGTMHQTRDVNFYHADCEKEGFIQWRGITDPSVTLKWEFDYLLRHPSFAALWAEGTKWNPLHRAIGWDAEAFVEGLNAIRQGHGVYA